MSTAKHPKSQSEDRPRDDLKDNPGIGQSVGTSAAGEDPEIIEGVNTVEGDVGNETTRQGGVDPCHVGRTNK